MKAAATPVYEVFALRYAEHPGQKASQNFIGGDLHDGLMPLDYFIWVIRDASRVFVVDTGFDAAVASKRGRVHLASPDLLLAQIDVQASQVSDVIITHLHYDHCGNQELFPAAKFHLQEREMAYATGRCMCHPGLRSPFEGTDVANMVHRVFESRVCFHEGDSALASGLSLHRVGGHTDGMQIVRVHTRRGWMVLASDASHLYANMEQGRSFPIVYSVGAMLDGHLRAYALADAPQNVIPGHDPLVTKRYPAVSADAVGRIVRLDADPR
jgi:glyoxylase-like metal-dependent hydrolase (beta-lactamase superfamily II)